MDFKKGKKYFSKSHKKYSQEADKQYFVIYGAATIIFRELCHWKNRRIKKVFDAADMVWKDIKREQKVVGIMEECERETGIVLKLKGKAYKDTDVFKEGYFETVTTQSQLDYAYDVLGPWSANGYTAAILIALHKTEGWGKRKRLKEFMENMDGVRGECRSADYYKELLLQRYKVEY